jgi:alginate O-acetyltransferase complex protein AlgI
VKERKFIHYLLFVTYFPHLIAGPVLHHAQMMPQFAKPSTYRPDYDKIALGVAIFAIGLAKKVLIANSLAEYADGYYRGIEQGLTPPIVVSWFGTLAYTFQIYFDFSGYSDMAIGLSLFFGVRLPVNFFSPYKSTSIIEFWRRWHISLSTFLRDYLYFPLGGNRNGPTRRYVNLLITMVLGGLWHGANWTFVLWGTAHGLMLIVNHAWRNFRSAGTKPARELSRAQSRLRICAAWFVTFFCVNASWVLFRAKTLEEAARVYRGLFGFNGFSSERWAWITISYSHALFNQTMALALLIVLAAKPTQTWSEQYLTGARPLAGQWNAINLLKVGFVLALFWLSIDRLGSHNPFLYFQF